MKMEVLMKTRRVSGLGCGAAAGGRSLCSRAGLQGVICFAAMTVAAFAGERPETAWRWLWNGQDTAAWRGAKAAEFPRDVWQIEGDALVVAPVAAGSRWRGADLVTRERFRDFELELEFRLSPGANSGIKYFVAAGPGQGGVSSLGLEYQLVDDERHPDAKQGRDGNRRLAAVYDLYPPAAGKTVRPPGEWNAARIVARGATVEHWLNGERVVTYHRFSDEFRRRVADSKYRTTAGFGGARDGHILLQDHGDVVAFRRVRIRELDAAVSP